MRLRRIQDAALVCGKPRCADPAGGLAGGEGAARFERGLRERRRIRLDLKACRPEYAGRPKDPMTFLLGCSRNRSGHAPEY